MFKNPALNLVLTRIVFGVVSLLAVSAIIFFTISLLPGDFASEVLGQSATPEVVESIRRQLGLNEPLLSRYIQWLLGFLSGDLGLSYASSDGQFITVSSVVGDRLGYSLLLAGITALIAVPVSVVLGIFCAVHRGKFIERVLNSSTLASISMPEFMVAYVLMFFLGVQLGWLPTLSKVDWQMPWTELVLRISLPVLTLTLTIMAHMLRMTRAAIIGVMSQPYIEMARCKGLSLGRIVFKHALPNAWAPIVNVIAFNLSYLIVGVVVIETVFNYPGIGQTMVDAVRARDVPVVQACALIFAATYIVFNTFADLTATLSNPRLLYPR
ncbi:ABC transporter permease [Ensifer adhaerens]|uniref:ABC transporter permease n=1 Tax=Ensifer adhaerens TaxID=106592 RepID=A0A0L8BIK2_ENSAD|nr:ABC transporter permease [Ensifer adhaerens]KOF14384.1 ABC transporter permease [Ensifer adhaerens]